MLFGRYPFDPTPAPAAASEGAAAGNAPLIGSDGRSAIFTQGLREKADSGARQLIERIIGMQVGSPAPPIHAFSPAPLPPKCMVPSHRPFTPSNPHRPLLVYHTAAALPHSPFTSSHLTHHSYCTALTAPPNLEDVWTEPTHPFATPITCCTCSGRSRLANPCHRPVRTCFESSLCR